MMRFSSTLCQVRQTPSEASARQNSNPGQNAKRVPMDFSFRCRISDTCGNYIGCVARQSDRSMGVVFCPHRREKSFRTPIKRQSTEKGYKATHKPLTKLFVNDSLCTIMTKIMTATLAIDGPTAAGIERISASHPNGHLLILACLSPAEPFPAQAKNKEIAI